MWKHCWLSDNFLFDHHKLCIACCNLASSTHVRQVSCPSGTCRCFAFVVDLQMPCQPLLVVLFPVFGTLVLNLSLPVRGSLEECCAFRGHELCRSTWVPEGSRPTSAAPGSGPQLGFGSVASDENLSSCMTSLSLRRISPQEWRLAVGYTKHAKAVQACWHLSRACLLSLALCAIGTVKQARPSAMRHTEQVYRQVEGWSDKKGPRCLLHLLD